MTAEHLPATAGRSVCVEHSEIYLRMIEDSGMHEPNNRESNVFKIKEFVLYLELWRSIKEF